MQEEGVKKEKAVVLASAVLVLPKLRQWRVASRVKAEGEAEGEAEGGVT